MTIFFATVALAMLRALLAGYGGMWFAPAVLLEALVAAWPLLAVAATTSLMRRLRRDSALPGAIEIAAECAVLVACFGKGWVEPHRSLSHVLGIDAGLNVGLVLVGLGFGALVAALRAWLGHSAAECALIVTAAWLVLGPDVYARFDDVKSAERVRAAVAITASFAIGGVLATVAAAWVARRSSRRLGGGMREASRVAGSGTKDGNGRARSRGLAVGTLVALGLVLLAAIAAPGSRSTDRPSIVLVGVDTLRADALDKMTNAGEPLMPRLAEIARHGVRFTQAVAPSPWTLPSFVSLLSAMNPHRHHTGLLQGSVALRGEPSGSWSGAALRAAGYQAAGFVNNPWLRPYYGFGEGYLEFRRYHGDAADGVAIASAWVRTHRVRPFFLLLHLMDPHWPYTAPPGYGEPRRACSECEDLRTLQYRVTSDETRDEVRRRYDAEVAYTDAQIGLLWDSLGASGVLERSWLVVTADHGEELWDHLGFLHGHTLYDELLRIPLIVVPPLARDDVERGVVAREQVRLEDVGATIFDIAGVRAPQRIDGTSLLAALPARGSPAPVAAASHPVVAGYLQQEGRHGWAVRDRGAKLIFGLAQVPFLYDLNTDPLESTPAFFPLRVFLMAALARVPADMGLDVNAPVKPPPRATAAPDSDVVRELRSLGYID